MQEVCQSTSGIIRGTVMFSFNLWPGYSLNSEKDTKKYTITLYYHILNLNMDLELSVDEDMRHCLNLPSLTMHDQF